MATIPPNDLGIADALTTSQHFLLNQSGLLKQDTLASLITMIQNNILVPVAHGGTGATTAAGALLALLPAQTGSSGKVLGTDGSSPSWVTPTTGALMAANNLSDVADLATAQANLNMGSAAGYNASNGDSNTVLLLAGGAGITSGVAYPGAVWITSANADTEAAIKVDKLTSSAGGNGIEVAAYGGLAAVLNAWSGPVVSFGAYGGSRTLVVGEDLNLVHNGAGDTTTLAWPWGGGTVNLQLPARSGTLVSCETGNPSFYTGYGSPEGVVTAPCGSLYLDTNGGSPTLWIKESNTGYNNGWVGK